MSLEVRHNRAEHTHENEQFRRVVSSLRILFEQKSLDGLLIGNPFNDGFGRFRADAILLYNHGLIIIDFKDYSGTICLPPNEADFKSSKWYSESLVDKQRIVIKAGSRFINPFRQLQAYRDTMFEVIRSNIFLNGFINPSRTLALNIFSGPIQLQNNIPRNLPYYKIVQEADLPALLYDFSSENTYSEDSARALSAMFKAEVWLEHVQIPPISHKTARIEEIGSDVTAELSNFLKQDSSGILILESMDTNTRDEWMRYILSEAVEFDIPQTETWAHSSRIVRKIGNRTGITLQSLYSTIYGGNAAAKIDVDESKGPDEENNEEQLQEVVSLRSDDSLDSSAVVILHEAHLVTRSLHQSEILKFGTGRLLEDLINFLRLDVGKRKLICIGDPYSLTYGKAEDTALNLKTMSELYSGEIRHYRTPPPDAESRGKMLLRNSIATQIEKNQFNRLEYPWVGGDLIQIEKEGVAGLLSEWFSYPFDSEPQKAVMVFSNKQKGSGAREINNWIKRHCLKNGEDLSVNDLLLINNNINIPDPTGFGQPTKLYNGMYLLVKGIGELKTEPIKLKINKQQLLIELKFVKLKVICLSIPGKPDAEVWLLNNYFISDDHLSKEEQIAFRIFVNKQVSEELNKKPYEKSFQFNTLVQSSEYLEACNGVKELRMQFENGEKVKTKLEEAGVIVRSQERESKKRHRQSLLADVIQSDPLVNAIHASYGWAITVHKSVGSTFTHTLLNAYQGETRGITNLDYFRWLYSAMTASAGQTYVVNPKIIHPLMECLFEDNSTGSQVHEAKSKAKLTYPDYVIDDQYKGKFPEALNVNVIGAICELTKLIEWDGFVLDNVQCSGDYLTKARYSCPQQINRYLILAFNNKGEKDGGAISSIRIEKSSGVVTGQVTDAIAKLFGTPNSDLNSPVSKLPDDYRREVYLAWEDDLKKEGCTLHLANQHKNQDVFEVRSSNAFAKFHVYYNGPGFFTHFTVLESSEPAITEKLSKLVTMWKQNLN